MKRSTIKSGPREQIGLAGLLRTDGVALIVTMLATLLLSALAAAVLLSTTANTLIAANSGAAVEAFYAAEAAFERAAAELKDAPILTSVLSGAVPSLFVDGPASGVRTLADGTTIDLSEVVNMANCGKQSGCSVADLNASTADRPWGAHNPRWRLYSYGWLDSPPQSGWAGFPVYAVSLVADDPAETDDDPWQDGVRTGTAANPGAGVIWVRAEAFGRRGAHRAVEGAVVRLDVVAMARWEAADPASRGLPPAAVPLLQRLRVHEVR